MSVGDLVRHRDRCSPHWIDSVGIVVEIRHPSVAIPDYRTPTAVLVFYSQPHRAGDVWKQKIWFSKNELEMIGG